MASLRPDPPPPLGEAPQNNKFKTVRSRDCGGIKKTSWAGASTSRADASTSRAGTSPLGQVRRILGRCVDVLGRRVDVLGRRVVCRAGASTSRAGASTSWASAYLRLWYFQASAISRAAPPLRPLASLVEFETCSYLTIDKFKSDDLRYT